jgi:hypothetical protein
MMQTRLRFHGLRSILVALLPVVGMSGTLAVALAWQTRPSAHAASNVIPSSLPTHFSFGIMSGPGDTPYLNGMRSNNGTAWDYRYQYLVGGVNTGNGWETWNRPTGAFATYYLRDSGSNGYMPAFVYYEMLQSNGSCGGCGEAQKDLSNLDNPSTMSAYYANWTLLMRKIKAYGKPTLVIVEPDLWGFMESSVANGSNSAASVPASVASSGNADAAGLPNTAQGYAWALLHIRDRYAPNAVLALHASPWGTRIDIASNTDPSIDATSLGIQQAQFLNTAGLVGNPSGISTFDVLSNDIADHDSGQSGIWWDKYNKTFPNFARYLQYASTLSAGTNRRILMWQVPEGNQYYDTENNSQGHTQDNKAEYILGHIADFANAGIIGVLFGPGNGGTMAQDARGDGITNPGPISTYECNGCNDHVSIYPDDDGGYLRITVGQYYKSGGYALSRARSSGGIPVPTPTSSASGSSSSCTPSIAFGGGTASSATPAPGTSTSLAITLTASCQTSALVDFEVYDTAGHKAWQTWRDNQSLTRHVQTFRANWNIPATQPAGTYTFKVGVFGPGWKPFYAWDNVAATITVA